MLRDTKLQKTQIDSPESITHKSPDSATFRLGQDMVFPLFYCLGKTALAGVGIKALSFASFYVVQWNERRKH